MCLVLIRTAGVRDEPLCLTTHGSVLLCLFQVCEGRPDHQDLLGPTQVRNRKNLQE